MMNELLSMRQEIDGIDKQLVELFEKRMKVSENVAAYKLKVGKEIFDKTREEEKIKEVSALAATEFNSQGVASLFNHIMTISRMRQYMLISDQMPEQTDFVLADQTFGPDTKVVYHGVEGAYGQQAMEGYFGSDIQSFNVETFAEAMEMIKQNKADYGVLPIENSSTGIITDVYDLLQTYDNYIVGEYVVKVEHALLGLEEASIGDITTVYSHVQGLLQCRDFLEKYPQWEQVSMQNTAIAAKKIIDDGEISQAAVASKKAADFHGLKILEEKINDIDNNSTRFIIIKNRPEYVREADQISICFELMHQSGTLYNILSHFIFNGLNMTKIESRPIRGEKWRYHFFIDFTGNLSDKAVNNALTGIAKETKDFRILGNYIKFDND